MLPQDPDFMKTTAGSTWYPFPAAKWHTDMLSIAKKYSTGRYKPAVIKDGGGGLNFLFTEPRSKKQLFLIYKPQAKTL